MRSPASAPVAASTILAEIGVDMSRFPTAGAPVFVGPLRPGGQPIGREDQGQRRDRARQPLPRPGSSARPPSRPARTDTFLGERYRRLARRRGKKRAIVAVGRSILVIIWHLLCQPDARYRDLGADYTSPPHQPGHQNRNHVRQLEALGYTVTLTPAA